jgi:hypothetical protein
MTVCLSSRVEGAKRERMRRRVVKVEEKMLELRVERWREERLRVLLKKERTEERMEWRRERDCWR